MLLPPDTYYQLAEMPGRNPGVPPLSDAQRKALEAFREVADSVALDFWLKPGDLQLVHNHTMVHNRSKYEDYDVRGSLCLGCNVLCWAVAALYCHGVYPLYAWCWVQLQCLAEDIKEETRHADALLSRAKY